MNIIEVCKDNAIKYSSEIELKAFHDYFDWSDHIAASEKTEYSYHLNKMAEDIKAMAQLYKKIVPHEFYKQWEDNWLTQTIAAGWVHDIGMIIGREPHGKYSAECLFSDNPVFDFSALSEEDRVKIGVLCVKHNCSWANTYKTMKALLEKEQIQPDYLNTLFNTSNEPVKKLNFSGRLISFCDSLRYRGKDLRNDLKQPFNLWYECPACKTIYTIEKEFCTSANCSGNLQVKAVVSHPSNGQSLQPNAIKLYTKGNNNSATPATTITGQNLFAEVRKTNSIYTLGDMALEDIKVQDYTQWEKTLQKNGINFEELEEQNITTDEYDFILKVTLDEKLILPAMFTLNKYLTAFLDENIGTGEMDSVKIILYLESDNNTWFKDLLNSLRFHTCHTDKKNKASDQNPEKIIASLKRTFSKWKYDDYTILPLEIIKDKVRIIKL